MSPARRASPRIYELVVRLSDVGPSVWRRVRISSGATLWRVAGIIAVAMDWPRGRPFAFTHEGLTFERSANGATTAVPADARASRNGSGPELRLRQLLHDPGEELEFEYGGEKAWHLTVRLDRVLPASDDIRTPFCVGGDGASPPMDVGGPWAYDEWRHEGLDEHELPDAYVPAEARPGHAPASPEPPRARFNVDAVNAGLERLR